MERRDIMKPIVTLTEVNKTYHGLSTPTKALQNCSLKIMPSTFSCIIGKSGCGKSTLLNAIGGLIPVDSGSILVKDHELTKLDQRELSRFRREHIGFIFQFFNLLQEQTVMENLMLPFDLNGERVDQAFVNEVIQYLDLNKLVDKFPFELSGGEQQRVSIARAVIRKPDIILADEPTGNLDRENTKQVMNLLKECQAMYSQTIIMVTHDIDLAKRADALISMAHGQMKRYETS